VRFSGSGSRARGGFHQFDLQARAQNLSLRAQGPGDVGGRRIGPAGLALQADAPALSRLIGDGPAVGPARLVGRLTGGGRLWRFAGSLAASRIDLGGYRLGEAAGPVELVSDPRGLGVKARLVGRAGTGDGWVGAALGAAPRAGLEAVRLPDGRLALKSFDLTGAGLKVTASGGRGLLGGLNFKGEAQFSNLAKARPGAGGAARADWSAAQGRVGQPWTVKLDAAGERLTTGYPELDRLLGPRPRFAAQAAVQGRRVSVSTATLDGAAFDAKGAGVLGEDGGLSLKLGWTAEGPFHAGPVEIAGRASGDGAVTGTLAAPRADLMAQVAALDVPRLALRNARLTLTFQRQADGSSGMAAITADSAYGPARARSDFRFPQGGVDLTGLSVDAGGVRADGALSLRRSTPSSADLTLVVTPGALLQAGRVAGRVRIADTPGGPRAQLSLTGDDVRASGLPVILSAARFTAEGPLARLPYALQAQGAAAAGPFSVAGRGVLAEQAAGYEASLDGSGRLGGRELRTLEPAVFRFGGPERSARLRLAASDGGRISLDGRLSAAAAEVRAQLSGVGLALLDDDLAGRIDADLTLTGRGERLDGALDARLAGARGRGAPAASGVDGRVTGRLTDSALTLEASATNAQGLRANAAVVLPTAASAAPFRLAIARQQPMRGRFVADGEVRPLWDLLVGGERSLSGHVRTEGEIGGSLADPQLSGRVVVADGRFDDGLTGLSLRQVALEAAFAQEAVVVSKASGVDGRGGTVSGAGRISLAPAGISSFRLDLHRFRLIDNEQATASASGAATIARAANGQVTLSGALTIDRADVAARLPNGSSVVGMDVVEKNRPAQLTSLSSTAPATRSAGGWALDVTLHAPSQVFLRGRGLNVELSLDAHVGGTSANPQLSGTAHVSRGDYDFAGKRFEFDETSVVYLATRPRDIRLDLTATRADPTLTAVVRIRGTAAKPEITFTSTPSLPSDEVLSQVLFGASASQLSPIEAAQLASALSSLASGGGLDVIGNLRAFAGLDRLAFGGAQASGVTVSGGKYITDKVYLELTGGGREGPTAQVEWRVRRELSILSRLGGQAGARLAVRWRRDY
jgi:translocation and assembly module TamB